MKLGAALFCLALASCAGGDSVKPAPPPPVPRVVASAPTVVPPPRFDYPPTRRDDVVDVLHGTNVPDPYRWLEGETPEVTAWFEAQDSRARRQIATLKDVEALWKETLAIWKPIGVPLDIKRGEHTFHRNGGSIAMSTKGGPEKTIFDAKVLEAGTRLTDFEPSNDGRFVAIELSKNGADMRTVRVLDTASLATLGDIGGIEGSSIVWSKQGFFYAFTPLDVPHATRWSERSIRFHKPGDAQAKDREAVPPSHDKDASSGMNPLGVTDDGATLLVRTFGNWARRSYALVDLRTPAWSVYPLASTAGEVASVAVLGSVVFASVQHADGTFDLVRIVDPKKTGEVVGHADARLLGIDRLGSYLVLTHARGAGDLREFYDSRFHLVAKRETAPGTTESLFSEPKSTMVTITREGLRTPPERIELDPRTGVETKIARSPIDFDPEAFVIDSIEATSPDGTKIPITVLRKKDLPLDGKAPLWAYGYGGFRNSAEEIFFAPWVTWAVHSGVFAVFHVRGGMEYGEPWHEAGARRNRERTIEDFAACLQEMHRRGYSSAARTMTQGWSHGGMLVTAVATQHPELQRVVMATVPLTDMIRFPIFGRGGVSEYGDPDDKDDFAALLSFSPYHHVKKGVAYPSFFLTASANDERAAPMHARKLAAALEDASTGGEVLLKVNWGAGHHGGGKEDANKAFAEATAFALRDFAPPK